MDKEIQKSYKKETPEKVEAVNNEHAKTAEELEIADRMFSTVPREAFLTLKDHKQEFQTNPKVRLINPTKPEVGRVAKKILDDMIRSSSRSNTEIDILEFVKWPKM